jgi:hypothetical protein
MLHFKISVSLNIPLETNVVTKNYFSVKLKITVLKKGELIANECYVSIVINKN